MRDPFRQIKHLPWVPLLLVALLAVFWLFVLEFFLVISAVYVDAVLVVLRLLLTPPFNLLVEFAAAVAVGALAVYFLEWLYPRISIGIGSLWALVLCLLIAVLIRSIVPPAPLLLSPSEAILLGNALGVFWKGRRYWR